MPFIRGKYFDQKDQEISKLSDLLVRFRGWSRAIVVHRVL